jgi:hypothetical protein
MAPSRQSQATAIFIVKLSQNTTFRQIWQANIGQQSLAVMLDIIPLRWQPNTPDMEIVEASEKVIILVLY